jgi:copper chaperone CopZ
MYVIKLGIDGMRCGQCEAHVSEMLGKIDGALQVKASHFKNEAKIYSPREISEEEALKALEGSGYRLLSHCIEIEGKEPFLYRMKMRKHSKANS